MVDRFERFSLAISEIYSHWHKISSEEMEKYGLKGAHSIYLVTLYRHSEGLTAPQLCRLCGKDKSDVSRMLSVLEKKGMVTKESVHQNRYGGVLKLTKEGMDAAEHVRARASLAVEIAGGDLTEEKREIFYESLELIASRLREIRKEGLPENEPIV